MTLPLADAPALAPEIRRARLVRIALALAAVAACAVLLLALPSASATADGSSGSGRLVVLLDVSGSVSGSASPLVRAALARVVRSASGRGAGLVLFSDVAEEALPPGTPTAELRRFIRFLPQGPRPTDRPPPPNPWSASFSSGTAISRGLAEARRAIGGPGRIVLISDLEDAPGDLPKLRAQLLAVARTPGLSLEVVHVPDVSAAGTPAFGMPSTVAPQIKRLVERIVPRHDVHEPLAEATRLPVRAAVGGAIAGLALLLAGAELYALPLRWRRRRG